jgi:hypothetical protein
MNFFEHVDSLQARKLASASSPDSNTFARIRNFADFGDDERAMVERAMRPLSRKPAEFPLASIVRPHSTMLLRNAHIAPAPGAPGAFLITPACDSSSVGEWISANAGPADADCDSVAIFSQLGISSTFDPELGANRFESSPMQNVVHPD